MVSLGWPDSAKLMLYFIPLVIYLHTFHHPSHSKAMSALLVWLRSQQPPTTSSAPLLFLPGGYMATQYSPDQAASLKHMAPVSWRRRSVSDCLCITSSFFLFGYFFPPFTYQHPLILMAFPLLILPPSCCGVSKQEAGSCLVPGWGQPTTVCS